MPNISKSKLPNFLLSHLENNQQTQQENQDKQVLSDFLGKQTQHQLEQLQKVSHCQELLDNLTSASIVWLDLELEPKTESLIEGAVLVENKYWHFKPQDFDNQLLDFYKLLDNASYLGGHNLLEFDLPKLQNLLTLSLTQNNKTNHAQQYQKVLAEFQEKNILSHWQNKTWDTLYLTSLFIPHQPSHALAKLYKEHSQRNDPIQDCLESRTLFELCQLVWQKLSVQIQLLLQRLLPQLVTLGAKQHFLIDKDNIFDIDGRLNQLPNGNKQQLNRLIDQSIEENKKLLKNTDATPLEKWQFLGLATFINWLRYFEKPQARRPVWINKHQIHKISFIQAELTYWQMDNASETWINEQCNDFFGFKKLRDGQMNIVQAILNNKDIPLGILPTGGGKSLTFQLPALILSKYQRQLTVIISPLKALIEDQVLNLHEQLPDYQTRIAYLASGQSTETQQAIMDGIWQGEIDIIYLSPERLRTLGIRKLLANRLPAFWVLDEAHTLSQWGTDFRPDFLRIADHILACYEPHIRQKILQQIEQKHSQSQTKKDNHQLSLLNEDVFEKPNGIDIDIIAEFIPPRISLVTATASQRVKNDLEEELVYKLKALTKQKDLVQYGTPLNELKIWRDNIECHFIKIDKQERESYIYQKLLKRKQWYQQNNPNNPELGVALVYVRNRKICKELAERFAQNKLVACAYHSKLTESNKKRVLESFKNNELDVVVCTNAFGMGIDKEGIHTVIHYAPPNNLESYVQEIGRAARKNHEQGEAYMLWSEQDIQFLFQQEKEKRIPNTNTLRDCWNIIKPTLQKPADERWFSANILTHLLPNQDSEELNTQTRVALLALERYGLLIEQDQQPAWIKLKLLQPAPNPTHSDMADLYQRLLQLSIQKDAENELTRFHLPELAVSLGYPVKKLLTLLRELVKYSYAIWQIEIYIRLPSKQRSTQSYTHNHLQKEFNRLIRICEALEQCFDSDEFANNTDKDIDIDIDNNSMDSIINPYGLDNWLNKHNHNLNTKRHILPMFRILGILTYRNRDKFRIDVSPTLTTIAWQEENKKPNDWHSWLILAKQKLEILDNVFQYFLSQLPENDNAPATQFILDDLTDTLERTPNELLTDIEQLQRFDLLEVSRFDNENDALFFITQNSNPKTKKKQYDKKAYEYLKNHYQDRCQRIHVLYHWLNFSDTQHDERKKMLEDYFSKPLDEVINHYFDNPEQTKKPFLIDYEKLILPDYFSSTQQKIIKETSRAAMVLAGPGSGKTTVVVHRVAYLLMVEEILPEKILVLAYNRLAVLELRERLFNLVGNYAYGVTIVTFHGLARQITAKSEHEAESNELQAIISRIPHIKNDNDACYQWLIEQAIETLKESPIHFQYIMVDEFQDIDKYQYEMIALLADLQEQEAELDITEDINTEIKSDNENLLEKNKNTQYEQKGYLMVVGDDDQNLYSFRGASIEYIQQFEKAYHLDSQQQFYLIDNYRSASNIVELANQYIQTSLADTERLKQKEHTIKAKANITNLDIRFATFGQVKGIDMAYWLSQDIQQLLNKLESQNKNNTIAILAPYWDSFDAIQHYLEQQGIQSQRYNESEDIIPINSVIGQQLCEHLNAKRLDILDTSVHEFLTNWRDEERLNPLDKAWQAIVNNLTSFDEKKIDKVNKPITYEQLLSALEKTCYDSHNKDNKVILITYHSAKGMEFDYTYVIDEKRYARETGDPRALYVALTRAKQQLTILQHQQNYDKNLQDILLKMQKNDKAVCFDIAKIAQVDMPNNLSFHRFLQLGEMVLTPKFLVSEEGREFIKNTFCKDHWINNCWTTFETVFRIKYNNGFYSPNNDKKLVSFEDKFKKTYTFDGQGNNRLQMVGFTTMLYHQTDLSWYQGKYDGNETSHFLIVPYVRFCISLEH